MPASAVIPAPRAYLKIVAVKKPVVETRFMGSLTQGSNLCGYVVPSARDVGVCISAVGGVSKPRSSGICNCIFRSAALSKGDVDD